MRLLAGVAVAQASSYSSDCTPSLGTSICHSTALKMAKKEKEKKKRKCLLETVVVLQAKDDIGGLGRMERSGYSRGRNERSW